MGLIETTKLAIRNAPSHIGIRKVRRKGDSLRVVGNRLFKLEQCGKRQGTIVVVNGIVSLKGYRPGVFLHRPFIEALSVQDSPKVVVWIVIRRIERNRFTVVRNGLVGFTQRRIR